MRVKIFSFLIILVFISSILSPGLKADRQKETNIDLNYVDHDPIVITDDSEFANYSTSGSGAFIDPYIIEGLRIVTDGVDAISVEDTTKYFEIRDCYFSTSRTNGTGINLDYVQTSTCKITNNTFFGCQDGINYGRGASLIKDNSFISVGTGIEHATFYTLENYTIVDNNVFSDCVFGIWVLFGGTMILQNNLFEGCYMAVNVQLGSFVHGLNNHFDGNSYGFYAWGSNFSLIGNLFENGMYEDFEIFSGYIHLESNTATNKGLIKVGGLTTIVNNTFLGGLDMRESTGSVIANNSFEGGPYGLMLTNSDNCSIIDNEFRENDGYGVQITNGSCLNIFKNVFYLNNNGSAQARDDGSNNLWYDPITETGNHWTVKNSEDIVDYDYYIPGSAGSVDLYPKIVFVIDELPITAPLTSDEPSDSNDSSFFVFPVIIGLVVIPLLRKKRR